MDVRGGVRARWWSYAVLQGGILGSAEQKPAQPERPQDDRVGDQSLHPAEADAVHVLPGEQHQCGERDDPEPHRVVREGDAFVRKGGDRGQTPEEERDERATEVAPSGRLWEYPHANRPCTRKDDEKRWHGAKKARPDERAADDRGAEDHDRGVEEARGASEAQVADGVVRDAVARVARLSDDHREDELRRADEEE